MGLYFGPKRDHGVEQPYILGKLKIRIPMVHYPLEWPDAIQGAILAVVPMGIIAAMTKTMGIPFEVAITMVIINNFLYLLHTHFGDPVVAGWITPGIPLYIAFLTGFAPGVDRIQAMIALQLLVGFIFLFFGVTGLAKQVVDRVPVSIKAGILLGAGIASVIGEFSANGRVSQYPLSIIFGVLFSFFMIFSPTTVELRKKYGFFRYVAQYGIAVPFIVAYALGLLVGEVPAPQITWSLTPLAIGEMVRTLSPFSIGFPSWHHFLAAAPLAFAAYIIAFGDVLIASSLLKSADEARTDEKIYYEPTRNHLITSFRNLLEGFSLPYLPLAGPQWTAGQALVVNRYINSSREQEESFWGGATSIFWGMSIALLLGPVVSLFKPGLAIGLSLTLMIQGYLCVYLAMNMLETNVQRGVAGVMGAVMATKGAAWGLAAGALLYIFAEYVWYRDKTVGKTQNGTIDAGK